MTDYPTLKNAPITEALLDIQVMLPPEIDLAALSTVNNSVSDRYPKRKDRMQWEIKAAEMDTADPSLSRTGGQVGFLFLPQNEPPDKVLQARLDGFTFSKLKPYDNWKSFLDEAKELWDIYAKTVHPIQVRRLGLRTINSMNLPLPFGDFKEYLLTIPEIAPGLPPGLAQFFMQLNIPQPGGETAVVTSAMQPVQDNAATVTVIFDIDVYVEQAFLPDADAIWEKSELLRQIRNDIFFKSLTERAKELF